MVETRPTPLNIPVPTVLAVGCAAEVVKRAASVLAATGIGLQETNLIDLRTDSAKLRPLVLLVDAELYEFDPEAFDMVAQDVGSKLGVAVNAQEAETTILHLLATLARGDGPASSRSGQAPPSSGQTGQPGHEDQTNRWDFSTLVANIDSQRGR